MLPQGQGSFKVKFTVHHQSHFKVTGPTLFKDTGQGQGQALNLL